MGLPAGKVGFLLGTRMGGVGGIGFAKSDTRLWCILDPMARPYRQTRPRSGPPVCRLCKNERELKRSHILPEFIYRPLYDKDHKIKVVSTDPARRVYYERKGLRERLLCCECEQLLSVWEGYASRFMSSRQWPVNQITNFQREFSCDKIDYRKFKLFQMSILWRMSVTSIRFFSDVNLGPHEETIRAMLLSENPGEPYDYGCVLLMLMLDKKTLFNPLSPPERARMIGHRVYWFQAGGFMWTFLVSKHAITFPFRSHLLQKSGTLRVECCLAEDVPLVAREARRIGAALRGKGLLS